ncbi:MAG: GIY-YIG nuclease family protein [Candidatus Portnoybacteria bacterium]|nr:GIY-YIG nuclease family protein [Candidatus Portnoybacteria bacterium]
MWNVYIIKSINKKWYYVGSTNRLSERISEHNKGLVKSTKHYLPLKLVFTKEFSLEKEARSYERMLKDKRIEKEKIIKVIENK